MKRIILLYLLFSITLNLYSQDSTSLYYKGYISITNNIYIIESGLSTDKLDIGLAISKYEQYKMTSLRFNILNNDFGKFSNETVLGVGYGTDAKLVDIGTTIFYDFTKCQTGFIFGNYSINNVSYTYCNFLIRFGIYKPSKFFNRFHIQHF